MICPECGSNQLYALPVYELGAVTYACHACEYRTDARYNWGLLISVTLSALVSIGFLAFLFY